MSALNNLTRQLTKVLLMAPLLAVFLLFMSPLAVMAQGINGTGTIFRADGTKGYFIVGSFNSEAACRERVFKIVEYLKGQAQWVGENLTYRINNCGTSFQKGTVFNALQQVSGLKNFTLLHPNFRMLIVSPLGKDAERNICSELVGYFQSLLGEEAVCISPRP